MSSLPQNVAMNPPAATPATEGARVGTPTEEEADAAADSKRRRRFFPRLKALLSADYEDFLRQILETLESNQVAAFPTATADNPWADTFDVVYNTVASDYDLPHGKNRLHKFKEKMVELWSAMEGEVKLGTKSATHPMYRMALRQWKVHQSVMKDKSKATSNQIHNVIAGTRDVSKAVSTDSATDFDHVPQEQYHHTTQVHQLHTQADFESQERPRKKSRTSSAMQPVERAGYEPTYAEPRGNTMAVSSRFVAIPEDLIGSWQKSLSRMEHLLSMSGLLQPKLPSPLFELHRLKTQMSDHEFMQMVQPAYEREIGRHLSQVSAQSRNCSHPGFLPNILEGLDSLRQVSQTANIRKSLDFTYRSVLSKYIKLIDRSDKPPPVGATGGVQGVARHDVDESD